MALLEANLVAKRKEVQKREAQVKSCVVKLVK